QAPAERAPGRARGAAEGVARSSRPSGSAPWIARGTPGFRKSDASWPVRAQSVLAVRRGNALARTSQQQRRLAMVLCAMACLIDQLWNQRALRQMPPEAAGQVLFERARINARRIEGAAVVGLPQRLSLAVRLRGPDLPLARAVTMMVQALAIPVHAVCRRGNQPALLAQPIAEVPAGPGENVMARLEPGQQVHLASGGR